MTKKEKKKLWIKVLRCLSRNYTFDPRRVAGICDALIWTMPYGRVYLEASVELRLLFRPENYRIYWWHYAKEGDSLEEFEKAFSERVIALGFLIAMNS